MKWIMNIDDPKGERWIIHKGGYSVEVPPSHPVARAEIARLTRGRFIGEPLPPPGSPHTAEKLKEWGLVGVYELESAKQ